MSVCLSVNRTQVNLENRSNNFHKNLVLYVFRAQEYDLDRSQPCKKSDYLSVCLSVNRTLVKLENRSNDFHKIWCYMYFAHEKMI